MKRFVIGLLFLLFPPLHLSAQYTHDISMPDIGAPRSLVVDSHGRMHVVWGIDGAWFAVFDSLGGQIMPLRSITDEDASGPSLVIEEGRSIFVWSEYSPSFNSNIHGRIFDHSDSAYTTVATFDDGYSDTYRHAPKVTFNNDTTILVVWSGNGRLTTLGSGVYGQLATKDLQVIGPNMLLSDDSIETRHNLQPRIAVDRTRGRFALVWMRGNDVGNSVIARWFNADGSPLGPSTEVAPHFTGDTYSWGHSIALLPNGEYLIGWSVFGADSVGRVYVRMFDSTGTPVGEAVQTNTTAAQIYSEAEVVADEAGNVLVAWEGTGEWSRVKSLRFDAGLNPVGSEFDLLPSEDTLNQHSPLMQLFEGRIYATCSQRGGRGRIMRYWDAAVSVQTDHPPTPEYLEISAYPNPFNSTTMISFTLSRDIRGSLTIYDILGRRVADLLNGPIGAGSHEIRWNASDLASGVYVLKFESAETNEFRRVILLK